MPGRVVQSLPATFLAFLAVGVGVILTFSWWSRGRAGRGSRTGR
jgi:hypothetical protein